MKYLKKMYKKCSKCGKNQKYSSFGKDKKMRDGVLNKCKSCRGIEAKIYINTNRHIIREQNKIYRTNRKIKVIEYYGGRCNCCGEKDIRFLSIDHINNDGAKHRKSINGNNLYVWIINNNYPEELQVLCWNCNCGKRINNGICPHKTLLNKNEKEN